jgi:hypothetical protein
MASNEPEQIRAVDPFASYNSDTVNQLTRMATDGLNALKSYPGLNVIEDSTSPTTQVIVTPGTVYMEDVLISVTENHTVDFTDPTHYVAYEPGGFNQDGWYYIVFDYNYVKSRPAPLARIKILKPNQYNHPSLGITLHFLKAVKVTGGGPHYIDTSVDFRDYDPNHTENKREYTDLYFGVETELPAFDVLRDRGRVVYESNADTFWFGYNDRWGKITAGVEVAIDTTGLEVGAIIYTDTDGKGEYAIATDVNTAAEMIVQEVGLAVTGDGRALLTGYAQGALVETGITVAVGDLLYLSGSEPGRVANYRSQPFRQIIGRALTGGNSLVPIDILFFPRDLQVGTLEYTIETTDWNPDGAGGFQYIIDTSLLDATGVVIVSVFDDDTKYKVYEADSQLISGGNGLKIYSPVDTVNWNVMVSAGGGGAGGAGGGSGTNYHELLFNLDYLNSGHTGFAEDTHTHNFGDTNNYNDVPSGETILFQKDTAVTGYTMEIDIDDQLVYISSGGAGGLKPTSTWTQPNHVHATKDHTLVASEIPTHTHTFSPGGTLYSVAEIIGGGVLRAMAEFSAGGFGTAQTITGGTPGDQPHDHADTEDGATANTWRPKGQNFTRQTKL